ncbi:MAG: hypothetical protein JSW71_17390 [Gemmatimonadota bacterium]|nr:MAG: hypothetical protein JSW71_17390 [Gemmatimonadota bacterium]
MHRFLKGQAHRDRLPKHETGRTTHDGSRTRESMLKRYYTVTSINGPTALLVDDDRHQIAVPLTRLPRATSKGCLLLVPLDSAGTPTWSGARIDEDEAKRRLRDIDGAGGGSE